MVTRRMLGILAAIPYVHRVSVLYLVGAGFYLITYWFSIADSIL